MVESANKRRTSVPDVGPTRVRLDLVFDPLNLISPEPLRWIANETLEMKKLVPVKKYLENSAQARKT